MDEFYIGYDPPMPPGLARVIRRVTTAGLGAAAVVAVVLSTGHVRLAGGTFAYGRPEVVTGRLVAHPYPHLLEADAGATGRATLLVSPGKHGAADLAAAWDGRDVRLTATRVEREGRRMLEVVPGSIALAAATLVPPASEPSAMAARVVRLRGEVVDSKCHLGVMVPGEGRTHAACASLCLRGGIPPALLVRGASGAADLYLLETPAGQPLSTEVAAWGGRTVDVTGVIGRRAGWLTLQTDPARWQPAAR